MFAEVILQIGNIMNANGYFFYFFFVCVCVGGGGGGGGGGSITILWSNDNDLSNDINPIYPMTRTMIMHITIIISINMVTTTIMITI